MYDFNYHRAGSLDDAKKTLAAGDDAKLLAGGMTLLPTLKLRLNQPSDLVDLNGIDGLDEIAEDGDGLRIGAMARHGQIARSELVRARLPGLAELASHVGDPQVRNRGTIGGSVANNDPSACYPAALLALNATVVTDRREIAADEFFQGMFDTALEDDEIITAVRFPRCERAAYAKFPNPASRYAMVGVMVAKHADGVRVAVTGAAQDGVFRVDALEQALAAEFSVDAVENCDPGVDVGSLNDDIHAGAEYRAHLIKVMSKRAVAAALA